MSYVRDVSMELQTKLKKKKKKETRKMTGEVGERGGSEGKMVFREGSRLEVLESFEQSCGWNKLRDTRGRNQGREMGRFWELIPTANGKAPKGFLSGSFKWLL